MQPENKGPNRVAMMIMMAIDHTWDGGDDDLDAAQDANYLLPSLPCHSTLPLWEHVRQAELRKMMILVLVLMFIV